MSPLENVWPVDHRSRNDSGKSQTVRAGSEGWFDLGLLDASVRAWLHQESSMTRCQLLGCQRLLGGGPTWPFLSDPSGSLATLQ